MFSFCSASRNPAQRQDEIGTNFDMTCQSFDVRLAFVISARGCSERKQKEEILNGCVQTCALPVILLRGVE